LGKEGSYLIFTGQERDSGSHIWRGRKRFIERKAFRFVCRTSKGKKKKGRKIRGGGVSNTVTSPS